MPGALMEIGSCLSSPFSASVSVLLLFHPQSGQLIKLGNPFDCKGGFEVRTGEGELWAGAENINKPGQVNGPRPVF